MSLLLALSLMFYGCCCSPSGAGVDIESLQLRWCPQTPGVMMGADKVVRILGVSK